MSKLPSHRILEIMVEKGLDTTVLANYVSGILAYLDERYKGNSGEHGLDE